MLFEHNHVHSGGNTFLTKFVAVPRLQAINAIRQPYKCDGSSGGDPE